MTEMYSDGRVKLFHANYRDAQAERVDMVLTDPPYGDTSLEWDKRVTGWVQDITPMLKENASLWVFGSFRYFMEQQNEFKGWKLAQEIVWEKHNGSSFHADRFKRVHEIACQFYRGKWSEVYKSPVTTPDATARAVRRKKRPAHTGHIDESAYVSEDGGPRLMRSVIYARSCHGHAIHPTQKPTEILDPLIEYSCPPDGLVLDPFAGSGAVLLAAKRRGLRAVGSEIDETYCTRAAQRLWEEDCDLL